MLGGAENCYLSHIEILSEITGRVDNIGLCGGTIFLFKLLKTTGVSETLSMYLPMYDLKYKRTELYAEFCQSQKNKP